MRVHGQDSVVNTAVDDQFRKAHAQGGASIVNRPTTTVEGERGRTAVQFPSELIAELDALIDPSRRTAYLITLLEQAIQREKLSLFLSAGVPAWRTEDHPELNESLETWVDALRSRWDQRSLGRDDESTSAPA